MRRNGKKITIIISIIILLVAIAIIGGLFFLVSSEKIAITKEQKLNKGIKEVSKNFDKDVDFNKIEEVVSKFDRNLFKNTLTVTANAEEFKMKYFDGYDQFTDEIKKMINEAKIQEILEVDTDSGLMNERLFISVGKVLNSLSGEIIYNEKELGIRFEELNDKYIVIKKDEMQNLNLYDQIDETLEGTGEKWNKDTLEKLKLSDDEKQFFIDNYSYIFKKYISGDMIKEESTNINLNGKQIKCSKVYINLDKTQIVNIAKEILQKIEIDSKAKQIIIAKVNAIAPSFGELELYAEISNIRKELQEIDSNISLKINLYCDFTNTYGYGIELKLIDNTVTYDNMFENNYNSMKIATNDLSLNIVKMNNTLQVVFEGRENNNLLSLAYNQTNGIGDGTLNYSNNTNNINIKIGINTDFTNLDNIKINLKNEYKDENNSIIITFYINNKIEDINKISEKQFNKSNSLGLLDSSQEEKSEYINNFFNNIEAIIQNAADNSMLVKVYHRYYKDDISNALETWKYAAELIGGLMPFNQETYLESERFLD